MISKMYNIIMIHEILCYENVVLVLWKIIDQRRWLEIRQSSLNASGQKYKRDRTWLNLNRPLYAINGTFSASLATNWSVSEECMM